MRARLYQPGTDLIDPTQPGGIDALLAFHRVTFGTAVMEADDDGGDDDEGGPQLNEHGFPDNTPWRQMAPEHQAAYWRHQSKRHEARASAVADYDQVKAELDALKSKHQTADEKAVEDARTQAEQAARADERARLAPRLVAAEFKATGAGKIPAAQLNALIAGAHAPSFLTGDGEVDTDKVTEFLTPFFQDGQDSETWPDTGQGRRPNEKAKGVGVGRDLFDERHGGKKK